MKKTEQAAIALILQAISGLTDGHEAARLVPGLTFAESEAAIMLVASVRRAIEREPGRVLYAAYQLAPRKDTS